MFWENPPRPPPPDTHQVVVFGDIEDVLREISFAAEPLDLGVDIEFVDEVSDLLFDGLGASCGAGLPLFFSGRPRDRFS